MRDWAPGVALLHPEDELPEEWFGSAPGDPPIMLCDLCGAWTTELWPLAAYPVDVDSACADGELFVCARCAHAVRPPARR